MREPDGRFAGEADRDSVSFSSSIGDDMRLYKQDIQGSVAHARMLGDAGIIAADHCQLIIDTLLAIETDIDNGCVEVDPDAEDIHMAIELELRRRIGDTGERLHTARSRNDQVALDLHLFVLSVCGDLDQSIRKLQGIIIDVAEDHVDAVMPGFTHLQPAQPVTLGFHLMAYCFMLQRDRGRIADCRRRTDQMPLGAAALAGTAFPIDQMRVAHDLGFSGLYENAADAVSDRDFIVELVSALAITALHLSRLAEDIILWASPGFDFCRFPDDLASGSSIMPQKKNPDIAELIRARTGRVWASLMNLGIVGKALPLAYNRDLQEVKGPLFGAVDTLSECTQMSCMLLNKLEFNRETMAAAVRSGFLTATDLADAITMTGVPFRTAHRLVGRLVRWCIEQGIDLDSVTGEQLRQFGIELDVDVQQVISAAAAVDRRRSQGGTSPDRVREQMELARRCLRDGC